MLELTPDQTQGLVHLAYFVSGVGLGGLWTLLLVRMGVIR